MSQARHKRHVLVALWMTTVSARDIQAGIFRYVSESRNWSIHLVPLPHGLDPIRHGPLLHGHVDGIITAMPCNDIIDALAPGVKIPVVFIGTRSDKRIRQLTPMACVYCDDDAVGRAGAQHFLQHGFYNEYGFVHSSTIQTATDLREIGFRSELKRAGKSCNTFVAREDADEEIDSTALEQWLLSLEKPAAVMAYYDFQAIQVLNACHNIGLDVPGQVSVLGVDNDDVLCEFSSPSLSSIALDHEQIGYKAAQTLDKMIRGRIRTSPKDILCGQIRIVERESTDPLPPSGSLVKKALAFIRQNVTRGIDVRDVVAALHVSRRLADLRFHETLGRSIHQAIEDARMAIAEKNLKKSHKSLAQIALDSGYRSIKTFETAFRKRYQVAPGCLRKTLRAQPKARKALIDRP